MRANGGWDLVVSLVALNRNRLLLFLCAPLNLLGTSLTSSQELALDMTMVVIAGGNASSDVSREYCHILDLICAED